MKSTLVGDLLHLCVSAFALIATTWFVPGFKVRGFVSALIASIVIGIANVVIWPVLMLLTLPINILTFGLFTFVVNAIVLRLCAAMLKGFDIEGWFAAIVGAFILALVSTGLHMLLI